LCGDFSGLACDPRSRLRCGPETASPMAQLRPRRDCHFFTGGDNRAMRITSGLTLILTAAATAGAQTATQGQDEAAAARILEHIRVLSSDEFEGRAPGSPGEEKSVTYLQQQFTQLGLLPGNPDGTFVQKVPMVGILATVTTTIDTDGKTLTPVLVNDYVALSRRLAPEIEVKDSGIVFVGYGVVAPEYGWDDFKGVDVRGKTVIMLVNDPPVPDPRDPTKLDENMFKGKAMTYYGRWTYKYEEAAAKGASACLIVHETGPAGYPFAVLSGSLARENFVLEAADGNAGRAAVEGWLTLAYARTLFAAAGQDYDALKAAAVRRDFHPVAFNAKASFSVSSRLRPLASRNVIARLEGTDPALRDQYVVYSAHWDHLGRNPRLKGDQIFHGAADDASGCAAILEVAHRFMALPAEERPRRSILFVAFCAEEQGLLGSEYYCGHPLYPLVRTLADINIDGTGGLQTAGPSRDMEIEGYGNSTLDDLAAAELGKVGRVVVPDSEPEKGYFYRADHFEFAKVGVPAIAMSSGTDIIGKPAEFGRIHRDEYIANDYHKVTDVIKPWWDMTGGARDTDLYFRMGADLAATSDWPQWKPGCEFKARRDDMLAAASH
jgi:Zn-dependent M28 family amino/carboxypeptidase